MRAVQSSRGGSRVFIFLPRRMYRHRGENMREGLPVPLGWAARANGFKMGPVGIAMRNKKKYVGRSVAFLIGLAYALPWYMPVSLSRSIPVSVGVVWLAILLPAIFLVSPAMLLAALYSEDTPWLNLAYFFSGLIIGFAADIALFHPKAGATVWILESSTFSGLLAPFAVLPTALGSWIRRRRERSGRGIPLHDGTGTS